MQTFSQSADKWTVNWESIFNLNLFTLPWLKGRSYHSLKLEKPSKNRIAKVRGNTFWQKRTPLTLISVAELDSGQKSSSGMNRSGYGDHIGKENAGRKYICNTLRRQNVFHSIHRGVKRWRWEGQSAPSLDKYFHNVGTI